MKKSLIGVVKKTSGDKTLRVEVESKVRHPVYGKYVRRRLVCYVHDERGEAKPNDSVEIIESRPMSRTKRWQLVRVI